jgi:hypothetical protein
LKKVAASGANSASDRVKHERHTRYEGASLKNALNAVSGLFLLVLFLHKEKAQCGELVPDPQLLRLEAERLGGTAIGGQEVGIAYELREAE